MDNLPNADKNEFDVSAFQERDTAEMTVAHPTTGQPTSWVITFAGPGHPKTVEHNTRVNREALAEAYARQRAQANGRKVKIPEQTVEEQRAKNIAFVVNRIVGWSPVKINGEVLDFSPEMATKVLGDVRYGKLFQQGFDFLIADDSFMPTSATS